MTKEELIKAFNADCTVPDQNGNPVIKGTATDVINWIADKFCNNETPPFSKAFTGMNDKNGRPIHEGDKVKLYHKGEFIVCQVIYDTKHAAFFIQWPDGYVNQYFMNGSSYEIVS